MHVHSSNLEPMISEKHGPGDEEELTVRVQKKSGKPRQCLYLLLVIFAIIASKFCSYISSFCQMCMLFYDNHVL